MSETPASDARPDPDAGSAEKPSPNAVKRTIASAKAWFTGYRADHYWLRHVLDAWALNQRNNGSQYAAAITYFSFLALFPLLLLAVSITGFVFYAHHGLEQEFFDKLVQNLPGSFGKQVKDGLQTAIEQRAGVGVVGLVGVALAGSAWIGNLRQAIDAVWGRTAKKMNFLVSRGVNMLVLGGLGLGLLVSLGLTAVGTSLTDQILRAVGLGDLPGATAVLKILGIAIAAGGDMIIFWWVLVRLPQQTVPRSVALRGALMASVGFELLKILGTFTIAHSAKSPTAGPFAGLLAVLIWIQLVARFMLFTCAWMATAINPPQTASTAAAVLAAGGPGSNGGAGGGAAGGASAPTPAAVGATLVGAGALVGAAATWAVRRPRARRRRSTVSRHPW